MLKELQNKSARKLESLRNCLPEKILTEIYNILIPMNTIEDKISWKFIPTGIFLLNLRRG